MTNPDRQKWDGIYSNKPGGSSTVAQVLHENIHLLPNQGQALDLACGKGGNALLLAASGLDTHAWDISSVAIENLAQQADAENISLNLEARDVCANPPGADSFDVIVVSRFLDRQLMPALKKAIRNNGLIFYQTFIVDAVSDAGPKNPQYRLQQNELLEVFSEFRVLVYREEGSVGDVSRGCRNEAMLVAQRYE